MMNYISLATAHPNEAYEWYNSVKNITLEARLVSKKVVFYEYFYDQVKQISEELAREMFPEHKRVKERPFLRKENPEFWIVLNRNRKRYKTQFEILIKHTTTNDENTNLPPEKQSICTTQSSPNGVRSRTIIRNRKSGLFVRTRHNRDS